MPEQITPETSANEPGNAPEQAPEQASIPQATQPPQATAPTSASAPAPTPIPAQPQPSQQTSGLAVAGLVLGIVAVATSFVPIVNNVSFFLGVIGLALAIAGNVSIKKSGKKGQGIAIAGIVLSIISIVIVLLMQSMCAAILSSATSSRSAAGASTSAASSAAADSSAADGGASGTSAASNNAAASGNASNSAPSSGASESKAEFEVTIDEARIVEDYNGDPAIVVRYSWTNNSDETRSFASTLFSKCFQDGVQLETAIVRDVDNNGYIADVRPGYGASLELAYKLNGSSTVEVEVTKLVSLDKTVLASQTFELS